MSELDGVMAVWKREFKVFRRELSRVVSSIAQPIIWLVIFGSGFGGMAVASGVNYQSFIFPGIVMMSVLFSSVFYGLYIVWDRKIDVLKAVLVAPVSRISIFFGKVLGGSTDTFIQAGVLLAIGVFLVSYTPMGLLLAILVVVLTSLGFVSLGLTIGSFFESLEGFQVIITFLIFPLFFLSGALFPLSNAPTWLSVVSQFNPLTYAVDASRFAILGASTMSIYLDLAVIGGFATAMILIGSAAFSRMK